MYGLLHWLQAALQCPEESALILPVFPQPRPGEGRVPGKAEERPLGNVWAEGLRPEPWGWMGPELPPTKPLDPASPLPLGRRLLQLPHQVIHGLGRWAFLLPEP